MIIGRQEIITLLHDSQLPVDLVYFKHKLFDDFVLTKNAVVSILCSNYSRIWII